ncbi:SMP-30/gluconolactonase/LRE family protein [Aerosakkonemataceae cyanobacterium BLCC-F154]|uniref:SMP-30/gluconolactonase/LRE family protein n=1 Tax=Floridaenema fluviatile BLCC-F154 TaxID=3153640 RepID=A0ABV4YK88_9CYAN
MLDYHYIIIALANIHLSRKTFLALMLLAGLSFLFTKFTNNQKAMFQIKKRLKSLFGSSILEAKTSEFRTLFPKKVKLERVATGFQFTEGPIWFAEGKYLLFSDIPANKIYKLSSDRQVTIFREPSNNSNGLTRDKQGRLIACEHGKRRVTRTEKDGTIAVLADKFQGKKLNSPNDIVVKSDGTIYFTDPPYGIQPEQQEQPIQGVYRLAPNDNQITLVADNFDKPNGLAFSPDEKQLYIDDSERRHIRVFDVQENGTLANDRIFYDMKTKKPGLPDGMKIDLQGNIYCTGGGGIWVFDSKGNHLGTIVTPEVPANCAWGDEDWQTLYITAGTSLYKIRVNIPGIQVP